MDGPHSHTTSSPTTIILLIVRVNHIEIETQMGANETRLASKAYQTHVCLAILLDYYETNVEICSGKCWICPSDNVAFLAKVPSFQNVLCKRCRTKKSIKGIK